MRKAKRHEDSLEPDGDEQWPLKFCKLRELQDDALMLLLFNFGFAGAAGGEQDKISICIAPRTDGNAISRAPLVASKTKTLSRAHARIISKLKMNENKYRSYSHIRGAC